MARRARAKAPALRWEHGNALALPYRDGEFDASTVGFGARNFSDLGQGLREMVRVVRPGGRVVVLEITTPSRPPLSTFFSLWFDRVVPLLGKLAALDRPIDILVNNAGTIARAPAAEHSDQDWAHVLQVNLTSQFVLAREIGRTMLDRAEPAGNRKIIFMASLLSFQGGINVPAYAAAKGGVAQLTKALSNQWAARGITVNAIAPGYIATERVKAVPQEVLKSKILPLIPVGRLGEAEEIARSVLFLAADEAGFVTGSTLSVNGGQYMT